MFKSHFQDIFLESPIPLKNAKLRGLEYCLPFCAVPEKVEGGSQHPKFSKESTNQNWNYISRGVGGLKLKTKALQEGCGYFLEQHILNSFVSSCRFEDLSSYYRCSDVCWNRLKVYYIKTKTSDMVRFNFVGLDQGVYLASEMENYLANMQNSPTKYLLVP